MARRRARRLIQVQVGRAQTACQRRVHRAGNRWRHGGVRSASSGGVAAIPNAVTSIEMKARRPCLFGLLGPRLVRAGARLHDPRANAHRPPQTILTSYPSSVPMCIRVCQMARPRRPARSAASPWWRAKANTALFGGAVVTRDAVRLFARMGKPHRTWRDHAVHPRGVVTPRQTR